MWFLKNKTHLGKKRKHKSYRKSQNEYVWIRIYIIIETMKVEMKLEQLSTILAASVWMRVIHRVCFARAKCTISHNLASFLCLCFVCLLFVYWSSFDVSLSNQWDTKLISCVRWPLAFKNKWKKQISFQPLIWRDCIWCRSITVESS